MTPAEALALTKTLADLYADATTRLLVVIAQATARGMDRPTWANERLAELVRLRRNAATIVTAMQQHSEAEVLRVLEDAYRGGRLSPLTSPGMTGTNTRSVAALAQDTTRLLATTTPRVLRWTEDVYRTVISEATGPTITGVETRAQAAARAVDRFATQGVTGFTDTAGRQWSLDTYAEMATRTATGRAHLAGTLDRYTETGVDLVIVSNSPEECPLCRPFEGNILSVNGPVNPPTLPAGMRYMGSLQDAIAAGLHHPNCTHRTNPYTPGLTEPNLGTENPEGYVLRQRQRELERRVRESKRRVEALAPLGPTPALGRARQLLGARRAVLRDFNTGNGRKAYVSARRTSTVSR